MKVINEKSETFEFLVSGYMLDYKPDKYYDNNWLEADIKLTAQDKTRIINLRLLQVEEFVQLEEWLNHVITKDKKVSSIFEFIDGEIRFRIWKRGPRKILRFIYHSYDNETDSWELILTKENIDNFNAEIERLLLRFPFR